MIKQQLLLKYKEKYICSHEDMEYDFIQVPNYSYVESVASEWANISIFISLLLSGNITNRYESVTPHLHFDWCDIFSFCDFACLYPIDENVCLYDIDEFLKTDNIQEKIFEKKLERLSSRLAVVSLQDLEEVQKRWINYRQEIDGLDIPEIQEKPYHFQYMPRVSPDLLEHLRNRHNTEKNHTALLLYSGGKDSTLSAIRLHKMGYNVDFIHFNNGQMRDSDKPYLTFKRTFQPLRGYQFPYELSDVDMKWTFLDYFSPWKEQYGDILENGTIHSEIRCLSCRMAMYSKAFEIAKGGNYKVMAEGARISQGFMLEQRPMIERIKELASEFGIQMLFPVLELEPGQEKKELIKAGFSSKSWESKCLLGRTAMEKSAEDEEQILEYYDNILKPKILQNVRKSLK